MQLKYERISHLIALATIEPNNSKKIGLALDESEVTDRTLSIRFSDFVKSQLHYYMDIKLCKKGFLKYVHAFEYCSGNIAYKNDAFELLRVFYENLAMFLLHCDINLRISVDVDLNIDDEWRVNFNDTKNSIHELLQSSRMPSPMFKEYLDNSKYAWIVDFIDSADDGERLIDNYATAASILEMLQDSKIYKYLEV